MIDATLFFQGFIAGFAMCLPPGPLVILILRKAIIGNRREALAPGIGSTLADGIHSAAALFGLTFVAAFLERHHLLLSLIGATVLFMIALRLFFDTPHAHRHVPEKHHPPTREFILGFLIALFNPITLVLLTFILAGLGVKMAHTDWSLYATLMLGIACGELTWWSLIASGGMHAKQWLGQNAVQKINRAAGIVLMILCTAIILKTIIVR